ncbi:uncharacterized protein N7487_000882 [Penicillium crustosum]|uniref:uncharacterized protein n=1 Tax=Penicillium crustosum TaxID=36656 RepID=UPI002382E950|nr:uncharacterized protein N7487_000882 [Penicillium crustosum]KAJ5417332.1 hypothetical protein N7487_000882 [Penicillium crustosum]
MTIGEYTALIYSIYPIPIPVIWSRGAAARYWKVHGDVPSVLQLEDWTALEAVNDPDRYLGGALSNNLTTSNIHGILVSKCQEGLDCTKSTH